MMDKEIKEKWLEALRSGEYIQGEGQLARERFDKIEYCCLGVLCEVATREGILDQDSWSGIDEYPPLSFMEDIGLELVNPYLTIGGDAYQVGDLNDEGYDTIDMRKSMSLSEDDQIPAFTFEVLADLIEEQL